MLVKEELIMCKDLENLNVDSECMGNNGYTEMETPLRSDHPSGFKESKPIHSQTFESSYGIPNQCLLNIFCIFF